MNPGRSAFCTRGAEASNRRAPSARRWSADSVLQTRWRNDEASNHESVCANWTHFTKKHAPGSGRGSFVPKARKSTSVRMDPWRAANGCTLQRPGAETPFLPIPAEARITSGNGDGNSDHSTGPIPCKERIDRPEEEDPRTAYRIVLGTAGALLRRCTTLPPSSNATSSISARMR